MNLSIAGLLAAASQTFVVGSETFICNFDQTCAHSGECQVIEESINVLMGYSPGTGRWATVDFGEDPTRRNARIDSELGMLKWEHSGQTHLIIFTPESAETLWVRQSKHEDGSEVLFGNCRNAF
ncbi:MAG: hypothetical protein GKR98_01785 [Boseongicola sp.]|nr:MAG: hypothetical protein GKR98_01785 [Boseongicola sp.]